LFNGVDGSTYVGQSFDKGDLEVLGNFRNPFLQVALEEILEFACKFDASRATANDDHVKQALDLLGALILESGSFAAVHDSLSDVLGIANLLEEARVFLYTGDT